MTTLPTTLTRQVHGRFDLTQSINFGFGHRVAELGSVMRVAFLLDDLAEPAGVAVTQPTPGLLDFTVTAGDPERVVSQASRILSVDRDGTAYDALVAGDPVLSPMVARRPGLRPVLFHSAYEALQWAVLSARRPAVQMARVRARLGAAHGCEVEVAGRTLPVFPTPSRLLEVREFPGIPEQKLDRMKLIAEAALAGELETEALRSRPAEEVGVDLRRFPGIGPFYSDLVTVRALGHTDALPTTEPRVMAATARLVGAEHLSPEQFAELATAWRPWRTWAAVAIRAGSEAATVAA